jgi:hypothetical protein
MAAATSLCASNFSSCIAGESSSSVDTCFSSVAVSFSSRRNSSSPILSAPRRSVWCGIPPRACPIPLLFLRPPTLCLTVARPWLSRLGGFLRQLTLQARRADCRESQRECGIRHRSAPSRSERDRNYRLPGYENQRSHVIARIERVDKLLATQPGERPFSLSPTKTSFFEELTQHERRIWKGRFGAAQISNHRPRATKPNATPCDGWSGQMTCRSSKSSRGRWSGATSKLDTSGRRRARNRQGTSTDKVFCY